MSDEELKDWLRARQRDPWKQPYLSPPEPRYRVEGREGFFNFFTLAGARAFLENEGTGKIIPLCLLLLFFASCAPIPQDAHHTAGKTKARVTFYKIGEDKWGRRVSCSSKTRAQEGVTVAAARSVACGTKVFIPALAGRVGDGYFTVQDRGSAVEKRKASRGLLPVVDVFVSRKKYRRLVNELEQVMEVIFL